MDNQSNNPFPIRPTLVPQARKYTRSFKAGAGKVFTAEDQIVIDIPPINHAYLTKKARVYFKFDFSFYDNSFTVDPLASKGKKWFGAPATNLNGIECHRKPVPMLDICGPYGFFRDVEVYDYLGNTLIEKVERHDMLAAMMADFYLDHEVDRLRPYISDNQTLQLKQGETATSDLQIYTQLDAAFGSPNIQSRVNGINLMDPNINSQVFNDASKKRTSNFHTYISTPPQLTPNRKLEKIPTWGFSIELLNFLGKGSQTFVPLHNGYRIVLKLNKANVPIKFGLPSGNLRYSALTNRDPINGTVVPVDIVPEIVEYNFYDVELVADLLEVSPQFDDQIDKIVHSRMTSHNLLGRCEKPTIIPGNYLSANRMFVQMHHIPYDSVQDTWAELGMRARTGVESARLLYNDAIHQEYKNLEEIRNALPPDFDPVISPLAFVNNDPTTELFGTGGYMYPYPSRDFKHAMSAMQMNNNANYDQWYNFSTSLNPVFTRFNDQAGKFLLVFDLSLNGYNDKVITGIDTTKTTIKMDLKRDGSSPYAYETDVFIEHDAIITVSPGKHTSVSF